MLSTIEEALATCVHSSEVATISNNTTIYLYGSDEDICLIAEHLCMDLPNSIFSCLDKNLAMGAMDDLDNNSLGGNDQGGGDQGGGDQGGGDQGGGDQGGGDQGSQMSGFDLDMNNNNFDAMQNRLAAVSGFCKGMSNCAGNIARDTFGRIEGRLVQGTLEELCPTVQVIPDVVECKCSGSQFQVACRLPSN